MLTTLVVMVQIRLVCKVLCVTDVASKVFPILLVSAAYMLHPVVVCAKVPFAHITECLLWNTLALFLFNWVLSVVMLLEFGG